MALHRPARRPWPVDLFAGDLPFRKARRGQDAPVQCGSGRCGIGLQLDRGGAPAPAVERRVLDPLAQQRVVAKLPPHEEAETSGPCVVEAGRLAAASAVSVDQAELFGTCFPGLLDDPGEPLALRILPSIT